MIRKFATVPGIGVALTLILVTILAGANTVHAQQTPAQQAPDQAAPAQPAPAQQPATPQPAAQQPPAKQDSGVQEATPEDIGPGRKVKIRDFRNWTFHAGAGANLTNGTTKDFVRGGGGVVGGGAARNYSKYFGIRADFQFDNLPLRNSALALAQAPGANSHAYSFMLDPIINVPVTKVWGGYVLGGPSYFHRSGKLDSSTAIPGSACDTFFTWWGTCFNASLPLNGKFLSASQNEFGENFGGGITRKIRPNMEIYAEFRYLHGKGGGTTTDLRPITVGVRW